jgi:hypothetical protein
MIHDDKSTIGHRERGLTLAEADKRFHGLCSLRSRSYRIRLQLSLRR